MRVSSAWMAVIWMANWDEIYLKTQLEDLETRREGTAELHNRWFSDGEIVGLIGRGEIFDATTLAALHIRSLCHPAKI